MTGRFSYMRRQGGARMRLEKMSVALMSPRFGINVGYVSRVMKNFGLKDLYLVDSKEFGKTALVYASHGQDVLLGAKRVSFEDLLKRFDFVVGSTAIAKGKKVERHTVSPERLAGFNFAPEKAVLLLGRDTTGLTAEELAMCDAVVHIPTWSGYPTLNISHALAVLLYAMRRTGPAGRSAGPRRELTNVMNRYVIGMAEKSGMPLHKRRRVAAIMKKLVVQSGISDDHLESLLGLFRRVDMRLPERQRRNQTTSKT